MNPSAEIFRAAENGDTVVLMELYEQFEERDPPLPFDLHHWLMHKAFLAGSDRLEEFSHQSAPAAALEWRAESIEAAPDTHHDAILLTIVCPKCGQVLKPEMIVLGEVQYKDNMTFIGWALQMCRLSLSETKPGKCRRCKVPMQLEFSDYHYWQDWQGEEKDLVLRCFFTGSGVLNLSYGLMFWSKSEGYSEISLDDLSEFESYEEMLVRATELFAVNERVWAMEILKNVLHEHPEHNMLIDFVEHLTDANERGVAEAIVAGHLHYHPTDPRGHYWKAVLLTEAYIQFPSTQENLLEAEKHIKTALNSRNEWKEAELQDCMIARLRNYSAGVVKAKFEALTSNHAFFAEGYYDYALFMLETDPAAAYRLFSQGAALAPEDPEYIVGKARCLLAMGKEQNAYEEFARARRMAPEHPGVIKAERIFEPPNSRRN